MWFPYSRNGSNTRGAGARGVGRVIGLAGPAVELDGRLGGAHALFLAAVGEGAVGHGEVGVQARLEAEVADLPREGEPPLAGLDGAARVEGAVENGEVRVAAAGWLEELLGQGGGDAALDLGGGVFQP